MFAYCNNSVVACCDPSGSRLVDVGNGNNHGNGYTDTGTSIYTILEGPYARGANCYAYAFHMELDPRTGEYFLSKPQPGEFSGKDYYSIVNGRNQLPSDIIGRIIIGAVRRDGKTLNFKIQKVDSADYITTGDQWLVALAYDPTGDYHWYRRDEDGTWSHKPGTDNICYVDGSGNIIFDPKTCNRATSTNNYSDFIGYYVVTPGG